MSDTMSSALHFAAGEHSCVTSRRRLRLRTYNSEELRRRFVKAETTLFRVRFERDDFGEKKAFLKSRNFGWEEVRVVRCIVSDQRHHDIRSQKTSEASIRQSSSMLLLGLLAATQAQRWSTTRYVLQ